MKAGMAVLVVGVLLLLGSCAPFATVIYRSVHAHPAASVALKKNGNAHTGPLALDRHAYVQIALRLDIATPSAHKNDDDDVDAYSGRYRFPVDYRVLDTDGHVLYAQRTTMDWQEGEHDYRRNDVGRSGGWLTVESGFDKFTLTRPGTVHVEVHVGPDTTYGAHVQAGRLIVYDRVYRHLRLILLGVGMVVLGMILTVIGAVVLIARSVGAATPVGSSTATPAPGSTPGTVPASAGGAEAAPGDPAARNWAMWCHLSALSGYVVPMGGLIAPLIVWLTGRERDPFIDEQGKEAVNFRLTLILYYLIGFLLLFVIVGIFVLAAVGVFDLVMTIIAGVRASSGEHFRYPLTLRMVR